MGVNTQSFLSNKYCISDVMVFLESEGLRVTYLPTSEPDMSKLSFELDGEKRTMTVFPNYEKAGFTGMLLDLGLNSPAQELMKKITKTFGGFYIANDCESTLESYDDKSSQNLGYLLKRSLIEGKCDGRNLADFNSFAKEKL